MNHSAQTPHALFKAEPFSRFLVRLSQLLWLIAVSDSGNHKHDFGIWFEQKCNCFEVRYQIVVDGAETPASVCLSS